LNYPLKDIVRVVRAKTCPGRTGDGVRIKGVSIDSRNVRPGDLFVAIKGSHHNGHAFVQRAVRQGAVAVVVSQGLRGSALKVPVLRVEDSVKALGLLAAYHRRQFDIPVVALTGSAGKTTVKELIAAVLGARFRVLKNEGTQNNFIGVPLTLLKLKPSHDMLVVELGTNQPGDIRWLSRLVGPDVAVFTNIGESHLAGLKTVGGVYREKRNLAKALPKGETVIFNKDDSFLRRLPRDVPGLKKATVSLERKSSFQAEKLVRTKGRISFTVNGRHRFCIKSSALCDVTNALIAICCGRHFNISYNKMIPIIRRGFLLDNRQQAKTFGSVTVINDTYNANPVSYRQALQTLCLGYPPNRRRVAVCGDMLELGRSKVRLHRQIGVLAAQSGVDVVLSYGKCSRHLSGAAREKGASIITGHFERRAQLHQALRRLLRPRDIVLVKGSRGMRMEKTIEFLRKVSVH